MSNSLEAELVQATALTFEGLAFVFPSPELLQEQLDAPFEAAVTVDFNGTCGGNLTLMVAGGVLPTIVGNMIGGERGHDPDARCDALGELANVICGNVLTHIAGHDKSFLLSAPKMISFEELSSMRDSERAEIRVGIEGGRAEVTFSLNRKPAVPDGAGRS
jgi:CheY-specific phosphatase CheX